MNASPAKTGILTGLIGEHISGSRSPYLHQSEADALGIRLVYAPFDFATQGKTASDLPAFLKAALMTGFAGLNVTHPYKQEVIPLLDELSPGAAKIGAVNTIEMRDGRMIGHNTDIRGFSQSLELGLPEAKLGRVIQFGAGGAGLATAHGLLERGLGYLAIAEPDERRRRKAVAALSEVYGPDRVAEAIDLASEFEAADGVVNATPIGMEGYPGTPFDPGLLSPQHWVADIVYFPLETALLRAARGRRCAAINGSGMVILQAAEAFDIFTGRRSDPQRMIRSFAEFPASPD